MSAYALLEWVIPCLSPVYPQPRRVLGGKGVKVAVCWQADSSRG